MKVLFKLTIRIVPIFLYLQLWSKTAVTPVNINTENNLSNLQFNKTRKCEQNSTSEERS